MKFVQSQETVSCIRTVVSNGKRKDVVVAEFDERLNEVAPHVAGLLRDEELRSLEEWLEERARLRKELESNSFSQTVLEALPPLLDSAIGTIGEVDSIDKSLLKSIKRKLIRLNSKLDQFHRFTDEEMKEFHEMEESDVLKEQLDSIKNHF